ncbi:MAG: helix-turn-helix domain-containing protein [Cyclobacteriaceae bacterium]|nr:helix-turn-helix domain-containing protein [Cyclobacteriaceae bacterium]
MENPFIDLKDQLNRIEELLIKTLEKPIPNQEDNNAWMNIEEAAEYLQIAKPTLYALTSRREIPIYKKTKRIYFKKSELKEWLEKGKKKIKGHSSNEIVLI